MARWNLRRGADLADELGLVADAASWRQIAADLVDGWDAEGRLYEQFAGYWSLEPLLIDQVAEPRSPPMSCSATLECAVAADQAGRCRCFITSYPRRSNRARYSPICPSTKHERRTAARCRRRFTPPCSLAPASRSCTRAVSHGCPTRPRRSHRHHLRRPSPRHDGRALASAGVRVLRAPSRARPEHRPSAAERVVGAHPPPDVPWRQSSSAPSTMASSSTARSH